MTKPKILLYLHHVELGQRYPISEDVVIGSQTGQILFPKDERLSPKHCEIFLGPKGLCIRDLGSKHGTVVDGRLLSTQKIYPLREGTVIAVGNQVFKCTEPNNRPIKPRHRKNKKRSRKNFDPVPLFAVLISIAAGALLWRYQAQVLPVAKTALRATQTRVSEFLKSRQPASPIDAKPQPPLISPFEMVYNEVQVAYDQYSATGQEVRDGKLTGKAMAYELRQNLIPKFVAAATKLSVLKPANELERRRIEANTKLVAMIIRQLKAMASFAETKKAKYSKEIDEVTPLVEAASAAARKVNEPRSPAAQY